MDFIGATGIYALLIVCAVISGILIIAAKNIK
jgi:hypothetical protein